MHLKLILFLLFISGSLSAQSILYSIPNESFENYRNSYNYTCWNDNFKTSGISTRKFINQSSSYNLNINFTDLSIHSLNLTTTNHNQTSALAEANSVTFSNLYAGDIRYAILQNGAVAYEKTTSPTNMGAPDSQMAEYGTWQNRRMVSTNFTNSAPVDAYFSGVEFTNWHSRFRMAFHVKPTADIINGQLQFTVDIPSAYTNYFTQGNMHAFGLSANEGFAVKGGVTAASTVVTGNTIQVTTAPQNLTTGTAYEVSLIFYALSENLSTAFASIDTEEAQINITANQLLPNAAQNLAMTYLADEGVHLFDLPVYNLGYFNCGQDEIMQDIDLSLENTANTDKRVRLCFQHIPSSNVVGYNAMIRNANGEPSGLPLQASKNWHGNIVQMYSGNWNREYTEIMVPANTTIQCKYTRTGAKWGETYGAFSHQLSTVGTGQSRSGWLEAGLGAYGENVTHSPDYQFGNSNVCDYRPFLVTSQAYGGSSSECGWTGNVGGMDMFVYTTGNSRVYQSEVKTRFPRYSPNLTETSVSAYSADRKLKLDYTFYLNRSDDFTRVYYKVKVKALENTPFTRFDIFQMGGDNYNVHKTRSVVYGNDQGVLNILTPNNSGSNDYTGPAWAMPGDNPWIWAGDGIYTNGYGGINMDTNNGMIIRSYTGTFNGVTNNTPYLRERSSSIGFAAASGENPTSYCLVPPPGTASFSAGDSVEVLIEAMILPKQAVDYYGPNTNFANALVTFGNSWQLMFREVTGNDVTVTSSSNTVNNNYPISVATVNNTATITMTGGKGYVPIIFTGLSEVNNPKLWKLDGGCWTLVDQSTWGNDFWQADYNPETGLFDLIYNVNQDTPDDSPATIEYYLGDDTPPNFTYLESSYNLNSDTTVMENNLSADLGDTLVLNPIVGGTTYSGGTWTWTGPNGFAASGQQLAFEPFELGDNGNYEVLFVDSLGCSFDLDFTICYTPTQLIPQSNTNATGWSTNTSIVLNYGGSVLLAPQVREAGTVSIGTGLWTWEGPNGYSATGRVVSLSSFEEEGTYTYTYTNPCGGAISATFELQTCMEAYLSLFLEGPFDATTGQMTTHLNEQGLLPGQTPNNVIMIPTPAGQPYAIAPWNYSGTEGQDWLPNAYDPTVVDWVLLSLRSGITKASEVEQIAALLHADGTIAFTETCALRAVETPYVVVEHRNHMGIMSATPVPTIGGQLIYDFRIINSYAIGGSGQKILGQNQWGMIAADGEQRTDILSYDINADDKALWRDANGNFFQYHPTDFDLNGDVNSADNVLWFDNNGLFSGVPK